jgi:inorganic phosphate transporter, PiT family
MNLLSIHLLSENLSGYAFAFLIICIVCACVFEFVNGFHDTANAVATVIYTNTLKPLQAVIWSGTWNFIGVWAGGIAVAMSIVNLLPLSDMLDQTMQESIAIILAILLSAIAWNVLTWYYGIPCSSSHTLIGSLLGAGLGFQLFNSGSGVNWGKAIDIGLSLLMSPAFGFSAVILLMFVFRAVFKNKNNKIIFQSPKGKEVPPMWIRAILVTTCTAVSFFHGSNDGQKGVWLMMIILMTFLPVHFALNSEYDKRTAVIELDNVGCILAINAENSLVSKELAASVKSIEELKTDILNLDEKDERQKFSIRKRIQKLNKTLKVILKDPDVINNFNDRRKLDKSLKTVSEYTDYAPLWVIFIIAISIGIGTMVGWKRIVVTIGEKIGKTHLTYAQGAAAEITAASTIGLSTGLGLPVSTTHVLSSGIAGSMVASNGVQNLQKGTITSIAIAWILTLPVTILLSGGLYLLFHLFI